MRLELTTSRLTVVRSNQLGDRPIERESAVNTQNQSRYASRLGFSTSGFSHDMDGDEPSRTNVVIIGAQVFYPLLVPNLRNSPKYIVCIPETVYFIFSIYWKFLTEF